MLSVRRVLCEGFFAGRGNEASRRFSYLDLPDIPIEETLRVRQSVSAWRNSHVEQALAGVCEPFGCRRAPNPNSHQMIVQDGIVGKDVYDLLPVRCPYRSMYGAALLPQ